LIDNGGIAHRCPIDKETLKNITFPQKYPEVGDSVLLWVDPFSGKPLVIASFLKEGEQMLLKENEKNLTASDIDNVAQIKVLPDGTINISVDTDINGIINISANNTDSTAKFKVNVNGTTDIYTSSKLSVYSNSEIDLRVKNVESEEISSLNIKAENTVFNDNKLNSFLPDINKLKEQYNKLEQDINTLKDAFNSWTPAAQDGGAALKTSSTQWFSEKLTETEIDDIKDPKLKN